jgi:2-C-methyl-D-erythritol 2,4-cyclodiphosphate synthase
MTITGIGFDVHRLVTGRRLVIGGVEIPSEAGSLGHSDGDVLLHAMVDAILGAANLGDIGTWFPSDDQRWKDADSKQFLATAMEKARQEGFELDHLDSIVLLQKPALRDFIPQMRYLIAYTLQVDESCISIKATTTDRLGFIGEGRGVAAQAVATLSKP